MIEIFRKPTAVTTSIATGACGEVAGAAGTQAVDAAAPAATAAASARTEPGAPSAHWRPAAAGALKTMAAAWNGSFEAAFPVVGAAAWLRPQELLALVVDDKQPERSRELLGDVLVARAAELDPSSWRELMRGLRSAQGRRGVVAENFAEALTVLAPFLDHKTRAAVAKEVSRLSAREEAGAGASGHGGRHGLSKRLEILRGGLAQSAPPARLPTKPLRDSATLALAPAEKAELRSVVAVDDEATIQAKIPADLERRSRFVDGFYSKGHLGRGAAGSLVCDTGNALEPGVCDHHQLGERTCAAALVLNRVELIVAHHKSQPITTLICHSSPDLDAVSSVFFAEIILKTGTVPAGASRLAHYVSQEDNARMPVGTGDPSKHLATLTREATMRIAKERHPSPGRDSPPAIQRARDETVLAMVKGILGYVLASGKSPTDESLFEHLDRVDPAVLPAATRADIEDLQRVVRDAEQEAAAQLKNVSFADGVLPRLDGKGTLAVHLALTPKGGKRLDALLRERHGADVVIISTPEYTWTAAEPTSGASLRPIAVAYEALERHKARALGVDRQPAEGDRLQPGWSTTNPYYIGGTDTFIITPNGATLTGSERLQALVATAHVTDFVRSGTVRSGTVGSAS